jgi:hypothetical protein
MLIEQKKGQGVVAVQPVAKTAAALIEIRKKPALPKQIVQVVDRCSEVVIVFCGPRSDAFANQVLDSFDQPLLFWSKTEIHEFRYFCVFNSDASSSFPHALAVVGHASSRRIRTSPSD